MRSLMVVKLPHSIRTILDEGNKAALKANEHISKANHEYEIQNQIESDFVVKNVDIIYT